MIRFSVVIPLYNKKEHIRRSIDSVLNQTYKSFEIIVVNDGSDDEGDLYVKEYGERVRLISQYNMGSSAARNKGIENAQFDFICLLDADDEWKPNFLADIASLIHLYPEHNIYSARYEIVKENHELMIPQTPYENYYKGVLKDFINIFRKYDGIINSSSVCLRKSYFYKLDKFPIGQQQGEDVYLWLLYGINTEVVFSNTIASRYYKNATNRSTDRLDNLPYQFVYYLPLISNRKVVDKTDLLKFLYKDALLHIGDLVIRNKKETAVEHSISLYRLNKVIGLSCLILIRLPKSFLKKLQSLRNWKRMCS